MKKTDKNKHLVIDILKILWKTFVDLIYLEDLKYFLTKFVLNFSQYFINLP